LAVTEREVFEELSDRDWNVGAGSVSLKSTVRTRMEDASCCPLLHVCVTQGARVYGSLLGGNTELKQCAVAEQGSTQSTHSCGVPPAAHCFTIHWWPPQSAANAVVELLALVRALMIDLDKALSLQASSAPPPARDARVVRPMDWGS
jgi:hypothetical protein